MTELIFRDDAYLKSCEATVIAIDANGGIILDRTVFYPEGGGQPGDMGRLLLEDGSTIPVTGALKAGGDVAHFPVQGAPAPALGARLRAEIDWTRRYAHMRMHTCLHLLSAVLPYPVTGGQVGADKSRLDFALPEAPDKARVNDDLNRLIAEDRAVSVRWITDEDLAAILSS